MPFGLAFLWQPRPISHLTKKRWPNKSVTDKKEGTALFFMSANQSAPSIKLPLKPQVKTVS